VAPVAKQKKKSKKEKRQNKKLAAGKVWRLTILTLQSL